MPRDDSLTVFSKNLKRIRRLKGLSQEQLAEKSETAKNYISQMESARRFPSPKMLDKLCRELKIEQVELFLPLDSTEEQELPLFTAEAEKIYNHIRILVEKAVNEKLEQGENPPLP